MKKRVFSNFYQVKAMFGTSLAVQWLGLLLPLQRAQVPSLVRELRSHLLHSSGNRKKRKRKSHILVNAVRKRRKWGEIKQNLYSWMKSSKVVWEKIFFFFLSRISKCRLGERKGEKLSEGKWKNTHLSHYHGLRDGGLSYFGFSYNLTHPFSFLRQPFVLLLEYMYSQV